MVGDYGVCPGASSVRCISSATPSCSCSATSTTSAPVVFQNFVHYTYYAPDGTTVTDGPPTSIDLGNTVAQLQSMWPGVIVSGDDPLYGDTFYFEAGPGFDWLGGTLTGTTPHRHDRGYPGRSGLRGVSPQPSVLSLQSERTLARSRAQTQARSG